MLWFGEVWLDFKYVLYVIKFRLEFAARPLFSKPNNYYLLRRRVENGFYSILNNFWFSHKKPERESQRFNNATYFSQTFFELHSVQLFLRA